MYSVVVHAHPVRGESHNQRNTTGEVATAAIYLIWIIPVRLNRKRYPNPNIRPDLTPKSGTCTPLMCAPQLASRLYEVQIQSKNFKTFIMSAGRFMHSYESNLLPSYLTSTWNLFRDFILPHQTCNFKKFLLIQGKLFSRAMLPQIHRTQGIVRNTWPCQVSISLWYQVSVQNLPTLWACWCKVKNWICLIHLVLFVRCDFYLAIFFIYLCILCLTDN